MVRPARLRPRWPRPGEHGRGGGGGRGDQQAAAVRTAADGYDRAERGAVAALAVQR